MNKQHYLAAVLLTAAVVSSAQAAQPPANRSRLRAKAPNQTGRFIIRLKETPPPPKLFRIQEHLEGQYRKGGTKSPYVLVTPNKPREFTLPRQLRSVVAFVEPEVWMYAILPQGRDLPSDLRPAERLAFRPARGRRGIGEPASGSRERVPEAAQTRQASTPNDQHFSYQWGMQDTGNGIRLPSARGYSRGAGVTVGIVDSGVRADLSDLKGVLFLPPYNAMTTRPGGTDDNGHGSHVAGTIAQATDNRIGCAGVAPAARILSVKALDANGRGTNFTIGAAVRYAVDAGCQIVNMSVGGSPSQTLKDAVGYATSKNVLLVCSSGNGGNAAITYPAAYSETLSVGAVEDNGSRAGFSQYGPGLGVVAPGVNILQQTFNKKTRAPGYFYFSGTSMAAPMVTGVAALVKSLRPSLTRAELKLLLMGTATDLGPRGPDVQYGSGLVNAHAACERAAGPGGTPQPPGPTPIPPTTPPATPPRDPPPGVVVPEVPPLAPTPEDNRIILETLRLFNEERQKAGLPVVIAHAQLGGAALAHAKDMRAGNFMSHTGSDGSSPGVRMTRAGYPWTNYGEIVAQGYPTPRDVVRAWMASPGHRAIILGSQFTEVGISKQGVYWCGVFGRR